MDVTGDVGGVKLEVYTAWPLTTRIFDAYPAAYVGVVPKSAPILKAF